MGRGVLTAVLGVALAAVLVIPPDGVPAAEAAAPTRAFASQPRSRPVVCRDRSDVRIAHRTFTHLGDRQPAISILGCRRVVIEDNDFQSVAEPIYVHGSTDVVIRRNRYRDITGPHTRNGSHRGNFVQFDHSTGGRVTDNTGIGGDTEDVVSLYFSGGRSKARPMVIARNRFQGKGWRSASGSGILVGDGGGSHVVVQDNVLIDVGQVGIGVAGGHDIRVVGNTIYGPRRKRSNVGIYTWAQGATCGGVRVERNTIDVVKPDGTPSPMWDGGNCGTVTGWATNRTGPSAAVRALRVRL